MNNTYPICGECLHAKSCHIEHNGHFMYCAVCFKVCELEDYNKENKPTDIQTIMEISAKKQ